MNLQLFIIQLYSFLLFWNSSVHNEYVMFSIESDNEWNDPNEVKVVFDNQKNALYFSREPIPSGKKYDNKVIAYKQVCVIPFTRKGLNEYLALNKSNLELIESVDMNRILENGGQIKMVETKYKSYSVDTPEDLEKVVLMMKQDWFE